MDESEDKIRKKHMLCLFSWRISGVRSILRKDHEIFFPISSYTLGIRQKVTSSLRNQQKEEYYIVWFGE